jgi:hypothetical protein
VSTNTMSRVFQKFRQATTRCFTLHCIHLSLMTRCIESVGIGASEVRHRRMPATSQTSHQCKVIASYVACAHYEHRAHELWHTTNAKANHFSVPSREPVFLHSHRSLTTEKCRVGSLIHTYPLDVSLCVSDVGGQEHSDLTLGTRLAGLAFRSRWPFVDDGVAILRLHSR